MQNGGEGHTELFFAKTHRPFIMWGLEEGELRSEGPWFPLRVGNPQARRSKACRISGKEPLDLSSRPAGSLGPSPPPRCGRAGRGVGE